MSDRIDELVEEAAFLDDSGCDKCEIVAELAAIARQNAERVGALEAAVETAQTYISGRLGGPSPDFIATIADRAIWLGCWCYEGVSCRFSANECMPSAKRVPCPFDKAEVNAEPDEYEVPARIVRRG